MLLATPTNYRYHAKVLPSLVPTVCPNSPTLPWRWKAPPTTTKTSTLLPSSIRWWEGAGPFRRGVREKGCTPNCIWMYWISITGSIMLRLWIMPTLILGSFASLVAHIQLRWVFVSTVLLCFSFFPLSSLAVFVSVSLPLPPFFLSVCLSLLFHLFYYLRMSWVLSLSLPSFLLLSI